MIWDCHRTRDALARGELPGSPEAVAHLAACAQCAELVADQARVGLELGKLSADATDRGPEQSAERLWSELALQVERETGPVAWLRSRSTPVRTLLALAVPALAAGVYWATKRRADWDAYPQPRMLVEIGVLVLAVWLVARTELRPLQHASRPVARASVALAAFVTPIAIAWFAPAHTSHAASLQGTGADFWPRALACLGFGLSIGLPVLIVVRLLERNPEGSRSLVLLACGLGGLAGNLTLHLHCPITHLPHLLVGHASIGVVLLPLLLLRRRRSRSLCSRASR